MEKVTPTCYVEGCSRGVLAKGLCTLHYTRLRTTGDVGTPEPLRAAKYSADGCSVEGCTDPYYGKGYCSKHWQRMRAKGNVDDPPAPKEKCEIENCDKKHFAKGMCKSHYERDRWLRAAYGLSWDLLQELITSQDNRCGICQESLDNHNLWTIHVDHDHSCCPSSVTCGKCVRGVLCRLCNVGIGSFKDSYDILLNAAEYLRKFSETVSR